MRIREPALFPRCMLGGALLLAMAWIAPFGCSPPEDRTASPPSGTAEETAEETPATPARGEKELGSHALPPLLYPGQSPPREAQKKTPSMRRWVAPVTPIAPGDTRVPKLPWVFEMSSISGWVPGPRGIVIDRAGVVWQYDHRQRPWQPKDLAGTRVTEEELAEKFSMRTATHAVDRRLFELVRSLAGRLPKVPLRSHPVRTNDYSPTFQFLAFEGEGKYREEVIASSDQSRTGEVVDLLLEWGGLQFGDPALAQFPKERIPPGALDDLARRIEAVLSREE